MSPLNKAAWRRQIRAARVAALTAQPHTDAAVNLARAAIAWLETCCPGTGAVCAYISVGAEPPTQLLLEALLRSGRKVYVPVCEPGHHLSWVSWHRGVPLAPSALAPVMEPVGQRLGFTELGPVAALFIPALAVDCSGVRLGQGGGYYDRFLAHRTEAIAALVYAHEVLPAGTLPHDALDIPLAFTVTPAGHRKLGLLADRR
ncbi:5-formyltetrahydrofolate cyclo-ligase [Specibacter sp. NPDC057265]|uniref:5-formyltetrahydrofolate cyclo-ligase n=1 Tax=Specibacter sp. NPDC057265 TaxID=3346075 RepID=UPI00362D7822